MAAITAYQGSPTVMIMTRTTRVRELNDGK